MNKILILIFALGLFVFIDYEVNKLVKSTNRISDSIYSLGNVSKSIQSFRKEVNSGFSDIQQGIDVKVMFGNKNK